LALVQPGAPARDPDRAPHGGEKQRREVIFSRGAASEERARRLARGFHRQPPSMTPPRAVVSPGARVFRKTPFLGLALAFCLSPLSSSAQEVVYFPPRGAWEHRSPEEMGMDTARIREAIDFSNTNESLGPRDVALDLKQSFGAHEPLWRLLGPTQTRGGMTGLIIRHGYVVAEWGDPARVDMTHSVTKTFLTTVVGMAWQKGLIHGLSDRVKDYLPPSDLFASAHNAPITWDHLLRQTSDWSGTLWGIPDWADRPVGATPADHPQRPMHEPGTFFKYNDVRVNLLALATLHVWKRPLPDVLREQVMDPIGASHTWHWEGYGDSWVVIDGQRIQSVSGGGHYGGGMFINAWDMARLGYLFLEHGRWAGREIVSETWISLARTPGVANPAYGFANWYLNPERKELPSAPADSVTFRGNGSNIIYIDWDNDLIVVVRWIQGKSLDQFLGDVLGAITHPEQHAVRDGNR
jgi:CubicO group peptidase (beta-lactamase class C family)